MPEKQRVSEKYRGLSQKQLLEKAFELGVNFEKYSGSCSQCTAAALREILGFEDIVVRVATSSCGGQAGLSTGACGGVDRRDHRAGLLSWPLRGYGFGNAARFRREWGISRAMEAAKSLCEKFIREYGSILCPQVQARLYGRSFNLQDPADWKAFEEAGGHTDPTKCMSVVGNSARWALEILIEKGII